MARAHAAVLVIATSLLAAGCQSNSTTTADRSLPKPSFDGPIVARPVAPPPPVKPVVKTPPVKPAVVARGPAEWNPKAAARPWRWIVVHHSATPAGGASAFDKMHRDKGWDELGYHFVIGNGSDTKDGAIEVGHRWTVQKWGAHTKTPNNEYNDFGIGICLVGNFDIDNPTPEQLKSLAKLTAHLMKTYNIPADRIIGHGDAKVTACPGKNLSVDQLRRTATRIVSAEANGINNVSTAANPSGELLVDSSR